MTAVLPELQRRLAEGVAAGGVVVLSGAGISTESGIPDYRGPTGRARPATPMTYQDFVGSPEARQRYWARSHIGWRAIARAQPNAGHRAVASLQRRGLVTAIITQNVDGLHQAAGATDVVELHGSLDRVVCLNCHAVTERAELDVRMQAANPTIPVAADRPDRIKPDGDVDLEDDEVARFVVVGCLDCGVGPLKPDVVFFGETVPVARVERCYAAVGGSSSLLVLGSSLTVASGYRFVYRAATLDKPVLIVNDGPTRGDQHAAVKLEAPLGEVLTGLASRFDPTFEG